ncbi:MAG: chorismate mutase [Caldilineaceae bacterium]|nr:chorismate mutase [Caldilineaceae bacterium]
MDVPEQLKAPQACETIEEVRAAIDAIDAQIVAAIGRRFQYVQAVTRFKQTRADVHAVERYNAVFGDAPAVGGRTRAQPGCDRRDVPHPDRPFHQPRVDVVGPAR